jgi:hypothetical protein
MKTRQHLFLMVFSSLLCYWWGALRRGSGGPHILSQFSRRALVKLSRRLAPTQSEKD